MSCWAAAAIHPVPQQLQTVLSHGQIRAVQPLPSAKNGSWEQYLPSSNKFTSPRAPQLPAGQWAGQKTPPHHSTAASANPQQHRSVAGSVQPACVVSLRWGAGTGTEVFLFCRESQLCAYGAGMGSVLALSAGAHGGYVSPCLKHLLALHERVWPLIRKQISSSQERESF